MSDLSVKLPKCDEAKCEFHREGTCIYPQSYCYHGRIRGMENSTMTERDKLFRAVSLRGETEIAITKYGWTDTLLEMLAEKIIDYYMEAGLLGEFLQDKVLAQFNYLTKDKRALEIFKITESKKLGEMLYR